MESRRTLIVAEKPDAALRIAEALDEAGKPRRLSVGRVPYYEAARHGRRLAVAPALGHLYTVAPSAKSRRDAYPVFELSWFPRYQVEKRAFATKRWIEAFSTLAKEADEFICACDLDVEGSLIGYNILKYACGGHDRDAKRMCFSTLTREELTEAYERAQPQLDFTFVEAGLTRHEVDFLYGVNLTRALTTAAKKASGRYSTLSTGRVQGPTLRFLANREAAIRSHVPTPFWQVAAKVQIRGETFTATYERERLDTQAEADKVVRECVGREGLVKTVEVREHRLAPPTPFNLGDLQVEAYRVFGFTPNQTLGLAERLYLSALISYPRTSSQKLPASLGYRRILGSLMKLPEYGLLARTLLDQSRLVPHEGAAEDPAHPSIFPTGAQPERRLNASEAKLYDLVVRRFLAVFGEPALRQTVRVVVQNGEHIFFVHGGKVLEEGWREFYRPYVKSEEAALPSVAEGEKAFFLSVTRLDRFTEPPPRFNPSSLLRLMEEQGIGTKATRAETIETLYKRGYIAERRMRVTDLGLTVSAVVEKYCPQLASVELTRALEAKMEAIERGGERRGNVIREALAQLQPVLENIKQNEAAVGEELAKAVEAARSESRMVGPCPSCKTGNLIILRSRRTGKRFVGCTNFFNRLCNASYPLPQRGSVKPSRGRCRACGWPTLYVKGLGRSAWFLCINPACPRKRAVKASLLLRTHDESKEGSYQNLPAVGSG
ncbi:MAG: DNA topoisomerase I [Candidatus Bathyarchaeia archaeon]